MSKIPAITPTCFLWTIFLVISVTLCPTQSKGDTFTVTAQREMALSGETVDLAVSSDGQWTFVLLKNGKIAIYGINGDLVQTLMVGEGYDSLEYSPVGNRLLLSGGSNQKLKILTLSLLYELDYRGSPIKGPADAPVTVAVFDDFQ